MDKSSIQDSQSAVEHNLFRIIGILFEKKVRANKTEKMVQK